MKRHLRLVSSNPEPQRTRSLRVESSHLRLVPDSQEELMRTVREYSKLLIEDEYVQVGVHEINRSSLDPSKAKDAIYCLSPHSVRELSFELGIIAEMALKQDLAMAAFSRLAEVDCER